MQPSSSHPRMESGGMNAFDSIAESVLRAGCQHGAPKGDIWGMSRGTNQNVGRF